MKPKEPITSDAFVKEFNEYREQSGLSYDRLAGRVETTPSYLHRLATGTSKPSRNFVIRLGIAMGLDVPNLDLLMRSAGFSGLLKDDAVTPLPVGAQRLSSTNRPVE